MEKGRSDNPDDLPRSVVKENNEDGDLYRHLIAFGSKKNKWIKVLREHFSVTRVIQLQYLTKNDIKKLQSYAEHDWEKEALNTLFKKESSPEQMKELIQMINTLKDDKSMYDAKKSSENEEKLKILQQKLGVNDIDFKILRKKDEMNAFLDSVSLHVDVLQETVNRTQLANHEVIQNASGGLALSGIYLDHLNNYKKVRTVLELNDKESVCLKQSNMIQMDKTETYNEFEKYDEYTRNVETLGVMLSGKLKASLLAASIETGAYLNRQNVKEEHKQRNTQKTYYCRERLCTVPVKSFEMTPDKVTLTPQAIRRLQSIEDMILLENSKQYIHSECLGFFQEFGSFVNMGKLEFGGIYKWKATYESESRSDERKTRDAVTTILTGYVNACMSFGTNTMGVAASGEYMSEKGKSKLRHNQHENLHTTLQIIKIGGPTEVDNFHVWRYGLLSFNSTWALLDRCDLYYIWDIVCTQEAFFENSRILSIMLKEAWDNRKLVPNKDYNQENELQNALESTMHDLKVWSQKEEPNIAKCYPILQKLRAIKNQRLEIFKLKSDYFVINNKAVKSFFQKIEQQKERFAKETITAVKHIMRDILHPFGPENWPDCYLVSAWMLPEQKTYIHSRFSNEIEDLKSFIVITEYKFLPYIESDKVQKSIHDDYITIEFLEICNSCLLNLKKRETFLNIILMTAVLVPFGFDIFKRIFHRRLNVDHVKQITHEVKRLTPLQETELEKSRIETEISVVKLFLQNVRRTGNIDIDEKNVFNIYLLPISTSGRYTKEFKKLLSYEGDVSQSKLKGFEDNLRRFETPEKECLLLNVSREGEKVQNQENQTKTEILQSCFGSDSFLSLLSHLGLCEYFPDKIQLYDVFKLKTHKNSDLKYLPWFFLKGIIQCNMRSRDEFLSKLLEDMNDTGSEKDDDPWNSDSFKESPKRVSINPLDLTVVVYQCCSPLLKQLFVEKMSLCKLAIPLVLNHQDSLVVNLWSTRLCIIEERTHTLHKEMSAADMESPIVSVIRLGEISMSKSIIINRLITKKGHDAFHHRNCSLGTSCRTISNGTIESAWYLSTDRNVHYLNLRGDALQHSNQVRFLLQLSSIIVVMLPIGKLEHELTQSLLKFRAKYSPACRIILAFDGQNESKLNARQLCGQFRQQNNLDQKTTLMCCLGLKDDKINLDIMCKDLNANISKLLTKKSSSDEQEDKRFLSNMYMKDNESLSKRLGKCDLPRVYVDENLEMYSKYRHMAEDLMTLIPQMSSNVKEIVLPLQGDLLLSLTNALKTASKSSEKLGNKKIDELYNKVEEKRTEQARKVYSKQALPFIKTFLDNLIRLYQSDDYYVIFVRYVKLFLDRRSREVIPGEREKYKQMWDKIQKAQKTDNIVSNSLKEEFKACEKNLADTSFGLEHLLRELSQIYEAMRFQKSNLTEQSLMFLDRIPAVAANLLLQGESFELMNGDVGNVCLTWIESVFYHLKCMVNDKKVMVLSVLGIQSSGKSTLLNTMFGLQFSVSAGRCTRGLYMQLLPVNNNKNYDYLLVVDTEGIRAPELKDTRYDHDNELATYVIGIGDVILINIKGENTIELTDILGIVVQALMRLRNVNKTSHLKKRCIFVHQNVAASDANDKMLQQRQNLVDELNERTKEAAELENIQDIYLFSDILHFNLDTDVIYFPDLWEGSPPMASINPDYSEHAEKVKDSVLSRPIPHRNTYFTISETVTRMKDLWNGLLADDFVFSFRNNLELKAYMRIQSKFQEISFELETYLNEYICNECNTELQNELETSPSTNFKSMLAAIEVKMRRKTSSKLKELEKKLECFFETDEKKDIVIQWKQNKINQLKDLYDRLILNADKRLRLLAKETKFRLSQDDQIADFETKAYYMAKALASEFRGRHPEKSIIEQRFLLAWSSIVADVLTDDTEDTVQTINSEINKILCDKFQDKTSIIEHFQNKLSHKLQIFYQMKTLAGSIVVQDIDFKDHIEIRKNIIQKFKDIVTQQDTLKRINVFRMQALESTNLIFQTIDDEIERFSSTTNSKFDSTFVRKLYTIIESDISEHNNKKTYPFKFTKTYESFVIAHTSFYLKKKLSDLNRRYNKRFSLKSKVEQHQVKAWELFRMMVKSASEDSIAVYCFKEVLSTAIIEHIHKQIPTKVADIMLRTFSHSKWKLITDILSDLTKGKSFNDFLRYIQHPQAFAASYLKNRTCEEFFHKKNDQTKYFRVAEEMAIIDFQTVSDVMYELHQCNEISSSSSFTELLRKTLQAKVGITISISAFSQVESHLQNTQTFIDLFIDKEIETIKESVLEKFQNTSHDNVEWAHNPYDKMMDILWGCDAKCPFCYEPCMHAQKDHLKDSLHKCTTHRVQAVSGRYWVNTEKLTEVFCNICVAEGSVSFIHDDQSIYYKDYKTIHPDWDIPPSPDTSVYWKWFCCAYQQCIEKQYRMPITIPDHWKKLSKEDAISKLHV